MLVSLFHSRSNERFEECAVTVRRALRDEQYAGLVCARLLLPFLLPFVAAVLFQSQ
jgi:hypothetical protein